MFNQLSDKILSSISKLRGQNKISEENIQDVLREIRMSLLEADVELNVAKAFIESVQKNAIGLEVTQGVTAGQQFTKVVHDELVELLGGAARELNLQPGPTGLAVIMMVGLQGAGKTTTSGKLAKYLSEKLKQRVGLVPADVDRPAAIEQLKTLGRTLSLPVYDSSPSDRPDGIALKAIEWGKQQGLRVLILDTAGRSQVDSALMAEVALLKQITEPGEILLVSDAMLGQQAVNVARGFNQALGLTGLILTKTDGDARGGAALSVRAAVGVPILFMGRGEKLDALDVFHPDRLASRILDMGDVVSLVEKAQELVSEDEAKAQAEKLAKQQFTLEDFVGQMKTMKKMMGAMGGFQGLLGMLPGMGQAMKGLQGSSVQPEKEMKKIEAMVSSMTPSERRDHRILSSSRRARVARGAGVQVGDVNRFIKQFEQMQTMMGSMLRGGGPLAGAMGGGAGLFGKASPEQQAEAGLGLMGATGASKKPRIPQFTSGKRRR